MKRAALVALLGLLLWHPAAFAGDDDPRDGQIFGGDDDPSADPLVDQGGEGKKSKLAARLSEKLGAGDRLQLGGLLYLRFNLGLTSGDRAEDQRMSMPNLVDVYLDARPNDRVRAMVRGRLRYDPTIEDRGPRPAPTGTDPLPVLAGVDPLRAMLNELWLKFDLGRVVFVTIGQQLVLWGTTRLWNPVDFVNLTQRPILSPFDGRDGVPMLKLHLPLESLGWNFYAIGLLDGVTSLDKGGVVGRAEFVVSTVEFALSAAYRQGLDPRLGFDISAGVWDLDLTGEVALAFNDQVQGGASLRASAGVQYSIAVFNDDTLSIGGEYFFNKEGTDDFNPLELFDGTRQFFYVGKHYAALLAVLPRPGRLDDWTFILSGVGNLSDLTFVGRLDISYRFLTYITVQMFAALHFGRTGELRIGDSAFPAAIRPLARKSYTGDEKRRIPTQLADLGLWLRVDL